MTITLTGDDLSNPRPRRIMEVAFNQGSSGSQVTGRELLVFANATVGSASVDGLGEALNVKRQILGGRQEVIDRFGYHSEALLYFDIVRKRNKNVIVNVIGIPKGTGAGVFTWTIANNVDRAGFVKVTFHGESIQVGIAVGDTPDTVKAAIIAAVNAQLHWTVVASSGGVGIVTMTSSMAGTRHDYHLTMARASFSVPQTTATITKSAVTPGSTDDDFTSAFAALEGTPVYYQVNPKQTTSAVSTSDNGIGEHAAAMSLWTGASIGTNAVLVAAGVGTAAQAVTTAQSINYPWAFYFHAEDNDWSPGMIASHAASIMALFEATDRAAKLAGYGADGGLDIPPPFDPTDRPTDAEIKTMLNGGVSPIRFTATDKAVLEWPITTKCLTNSVADYRARPGHIPSVGWDLRDALLLRWNSLAQPKFQGADPVDGQKPQAGFMYPGDVKSIVATVLTEKSTAGAATTLDPSLLNDSIASITVEPTTTGFNVRFAYFPVKHDLIDRFLAQDNNPSI